MRKSVLFLLSFLILDFAEKIQETKLAGSYPFIRVYNYKDTISSQKCQAAISSERYVLSGQCFQEYENTSSSAPTGSYMLSSDETTVITFSAYSDSACTMYVGNISYSDGDCLHTGDNSYISVSVSVASNPDLLPGIYYVGYQTKLDCENMINPPDSYFVRYSANQCTATVKGYYYNGLCQANGNLSYSVYRNPACSGTAFFSGIKAPPGPLNHGCMSRLSLDEEYESTDSSSEWVRFYCGTNQAFPGVDSPTPQPAAASTIKPSTAILNQFTGYLKQEFFTDSGCVNPYKTIFTASGRCIDSLANKYNNANSSSITQFTIVGNQVVKDVAFYSGLGCHMLEDQYTQYTTSTSCELYPHGSDGNDFRNDLYVTQSFVEGTANPTWSFVGVVSTSYYTTYDNCKYGVKPVTLVVYRNNTCFTSYKSYSSSSYFTGTLAEGTSYTMHVVQSNSSSTCGAADKNFYRYSTTPRDPVCYASGSPAWRLGIAQCGTTIPRSMAAPTLAPVRSPSTAFTSFQPITRPSTAFTSFQPITRPSTDSTSFQPFTRPTTDSTSTKPIVASPSKPTAKSSSKPIVRPTAKSSSKPIVRPTAKSSSKPIAPSFASSFAPTKRRKIKTAEPTASPSKSTCRPSFLATRSPSKKVKAANPTVKPTKRSK